MRKWFLAILAASLAWNAPAQMIVFDPTNFTQTTISAAEALKATAQRAEAYALQLQQYQTQLKQLQNMDTALASGILARNNTELNSAMQLLATVNQMYGSVEQVRSRYNSRLDEVKVLGLSWDKYLQYEQSRISRNVQGAADRAREEVRIIERVTRDMEYARELESQIPGSTGVHESMQHLNVQMNRMLTQGADYARMMSAMANASGLAVEAAQQQNEQDQRDLEQLRRLNGLTKARVGAERRVLQPAQP
jgi:type IV secretion system protein TrbJ